MCPPMRKCKLCFQSMYVLNGFAVCRAITSQCLTTLVLLQPCGHHATHIDNARAVLFVCPLR